MKRTIAAILAADIAGFSRLVAEDEEETLRRLVTYRAVFSDFITRSGGRIFNTAGDAVLAEFPSAVEAVRCALDVQESLRTHNLSYAPSRHMLFRIGITIGDVVERDGDLLGDGVNVAARLEGISPVGGVCISRSVHEAVAGKLNVKFSDRGQQRLKNIPEPVHAFTLGAGAWGGPSDASPPPEPTATYASKMQWGMTAGAIAAVCAAGYYFFAPASDVKVVATPPPAASIVTQQIELEAAAPDSNSQLASSRVEQLVDSPKAEPAIEPAVAPPIDSPIPEPAATIAPAAPIAPAPPVVVAATEATDAAAQSSTEMLDTAAMMKILPERLAECRNGSLDSALSACKVVIDNKSYVSSEYGELAVKYGRALRKAGRQDEAITAYTGAIDVQPTAGAYNHRGIAHHEKSDWKSAIADFTEANRLAPQDGEAINNRAWTYYKEGDFDAALKDADRAVRLLPNKAYTWDTRGHINVALGKRSAAIADFRKAVSLNGTLKTSLDALKELEATP